MKLAGDALHFPALEPVRAGMPELCRAGLSENWLHKACGHRHWIALAAAYGLDRPDFRDIEGNRLYPAFTSVHLEGGRLDAAREHLWIDFDVSLTRIGRTRFRSVTLLYCDGEPMGVMTMESAFVRRTIQGRNQSASRTPVAGACRLLPPASSDSLFRPSQWVEAHGFRRSGRAALATTTLDPNPHEDFNGADFLYFASFQALADRAEWAWFRRSDPILTTASRQIVFSGNIELGDRVVATLCGQRSQGERLWTWTELARARDGEQIGLVFTERRPCRDRDAGERLR